MRPAALALAALAVLAASAADAMRYDLHGNLLMDSNDDDNFISSRNGDNDIGIDDYESDISLEQLLQPDIQKSENVESPLTPEIWESSPRLVKKGKTRRSSLIYLFRRACVRRGGNCDHRPKDCCYNSACRCNLWGANCRCQRMGLFQKWGK